MTRRDDNDDGGGDGDDDDHDDDDRYTLDVVFTILNFSGTLKCTYFA